MIESRELPPGTLPEAPEALLLYSGSLSADERNLARVLTFLGIPWKAVTAAEIARVVASDGKRSNVCLLSSAACLAGVMTSAADSGSALPPWIASMSSVFLYGFRADKACEALLRFVSGDLQARIRALNGPAAAVFVTGDFPEMCGPMSGLQVPVRVRSDDFVFDVPCPGGGFRSLLRADGGEMLFGTERQGQLFYLSACCGIVDLDSPSAEYFDVRTAFGHAVPLILYLKWAFRDVGWRSPETSACLVVDDPPLKRRYGFLQFPEALELMDRFNFTTSIGFIPWNWQRTDRQTLDIFRKHPDRFSLVVHGCDHTASEFAARSTAVLNRRIKLAVERMDSFARSSAISYNRAMVFPQGAFAPETGRALKLNGFAAAVNTEVAPSCGDCNTTIADLWDVAIMKYGAFPIFTRRYLTHGIENFAFDALLGKPCLIAAHHDAFKDHARELINLIAKLNSSPRPVQWRPVGDVIRRSFKSRRMADGTMLIAMFGEEATVENQHRVPLETVFIRREDEPNSVKAVTVNETPVEFSYNGEDLQFAATVAPQASATVRIVYFDQLAAEESHEGVRRRMKTRARRHLSEFRDNYLSQSELLYEGATRIKRALRGVLS
ncbi:MAG: hypothetical protein ACRD3D_05435 [Terriglobia bacterium]